MEKVFVGSARIIKTQYGDLTKVSFSAQDIETLKSNLNNGWVNCVIKEKREKVEGKPTHYLEIDKWKPEAQSTQQPVQPTQTQDPAPQYVQQNNCSELPF